MQPPRLAAWAVWRVLPPACREHVLGDLEERCTGPRRYILDALSTVPLVILSQIRRTTDPQVLVMEIFAVWISFFVSAWCTKGWEYFDGQAFLSLGISSSIVLTAFTLVKAYGVPGKREVYRPIEEAGQAVCIAWMPHFVLSTLLPREPLLSLAYFLGLSMSALLLSILRILFPPYRPRDLESPDPWQLDTGLNLGPLFVAFFGLMTAIPPSGMGRAVGGTMFAIALFVGFQLYRKGFFGLDVDRASLEQHRDALSRIWSWYLGPLLGAMALSMLQVRPRPIIVPIVILSAGWSLLVAWSARRARGNQE